MDVYDEVDRRENDSVWLSTHDHTSIVSDRQAVPFLPVNPEFSATRNQVHVHFTEYQTSPKYCYVFIHPAPLRHNPHIFCFNFKLA